VGSCVDSGGVTHGFTYNINTKTYTSVDAPGSTGTIVNGVNDEGSIVGFFTTGAIVGGVTVTDGFVATPEPGSLGATRHWPDCDRLQVSQARCLTSPLTV
jgi:hypothetical protein